ncbi:MAG: TerC family protein [Rhizobiales bacterium]|nr:TerC family protein [Hyphomicrobiales bacterium]
MQVEGLWADVLSTTFWIGVGKIIGVNIILSGDNAVVIALACRMLPPRQRMWGMILGAGVAVLLRILFTLVVAQAMEYPYLKLVGGILLLWVAIKLVVPEESHGEGKIEAAENLWRAVRIVAIADIVMSLDNVIAIAATAETAAALVDPAHASTIKAILIIIGLATSIPMIVAGSALLMMLLERYPILVWAGAGLLGWVAGDIMIKDDALYRWFPATVVDLIHRYPVFGSLYLNIAAIAGAIFVIAFGYIVMRMRRPAAEVGDA